MSKRKHNAKYNTNFRYYFTICQIVNLGEERAKSRFEEEEKKEQNTSQPNEPPAGDTIIDTLGEKVKQNVVIICIGDSRGFVHMNHLFL